MRMDNETFRLKVENLFNSLRSADGDGTVHDYGRAGAAGGDAAKEPVLPQGSGGARRS